MGSLERRLAKLEQVTEERESVIGREVLRRMTLEELLSYESILERAIARGEPLRALPEDAPMVRRVWEIYEEVEGEFASQA